MILSIRDAAGAREAYRAMLDRVKALGRDAAIEGVLASPMARPGTEIIIGAVRDELFGPILMVGLGGVATELFKDVVYRPAPVSEVQARAMLEELKSEPLLRGFRGAPPADISALTALIARVAQIAAALDVDEIELNPVIVHPEGHGVTLADALVVCRRPAARHEATKAHPCTH